MASGFVGFLTREQCHDLAHPRALRIPFTCTNDAVAMPPRTDVYDPNPIKNDRNQ